MTPTDGRTLEAYREIESSWNIRQTCIWLIVMYSGISRQLSRDQILIQQNVFLRTDTYSWWRHQMKKVSALLALCEGNPPVTGGFPSQKPDTRSFDVSYDLHQNKRLSKQSTRRWFRRHGSHYDVIVMYFIGWYKIINWYLVDQCTVWESFEQIFLSLFIGP